MPRYNHPTNRRDKSRSGRHARHKGAAAEREVCGILTALSGIVVKRNINQARDGGYDVFFQGFYVEVKRQETPRMTTWLDQAHANAAAEGMLPALFWRQSRTPWRVFIELTPEQFAKLAPTISAILSAPEEEPGDVPV